MSTAETSHASSGRTVEDATAVETSPASPAVAVIPPMLTERVPTAAAPIVIPDLRRTHFVRVWGFAGAFLALVDVGLLVWWWTL